MAVEHLHCSFFQHFRISRFCFKRVFDAFNRLVKQCGVLQFLCAQVTVAGRQSKTRFLIALQFCRNNANRHAELTNHLFDDRQLLIVFFTENGNIGTHDAEELHDDRADAFKKSRTIEPFKNVGEFRVWLNSESLGLRIHVFFARREDIINDTLFFELFAVLFQRSGVLIKVLIGSELQTINKNRRYHRVAVLAGFLHQVQMTFMKIAHGRNQSDVLLPLELFLKSFDCMNNFHFFSKKSEGVLGRRKFAVFNSFHVIGHGFFNACGSFHKVFSKSRFTAGKDSQQIL